MRPFFLLCVLAVVTLASSAVAKMIPIAAEGVRMEVPDDWKTDSPQGFALIATSPDQKSGITLRILPNRGEARIDESFYLEAMKKARQQKADADHGSLIIIQAGTVSINGVAASYIHTEEPMPDGQTNYGRGFLIAANGKFYSMSTDTDDPFMDQKLNDFVGTFRFDSPPLFPDKERPFYHRLAQVTGSVACIAFFIGFFVWLSARQQKSEME